MKYADMQDCATEVFLPDKHQWTNLAWEIGQLIPSDDFDAVCWLVILGDTKTVYGFGLDLPRVMCFSGIMRKILTPNLHYITPRTSTLTLQWSISD